MKPLRDKTNHSRNRDDSLSFASRDPIVRDRTISSQGPGMTEYRRILLDGYPVVVTRDGERLHAKDGRSVALQDAIHLPPVEPRKIICVHLNYKSRVDEFMATLPATPTYFHKPVSALCGHGARVVRPERCQWLNYEGEVAIVIGRHCRNIAREEAGEYIAGYTVANDYGLHDFRDTDSGSMLRVKGSTPSARSALPW